MDKLEIIKNDKQLAKDLKKFCDFELLTEKEKYNNGSVELNFEGEIFGESTKGNEKHGQYIISGKKAGNFILLSDNSIAFSYANSGAGRIAETTTELLELLINIPDWKEFDYIGLYENDNLLNDYIAKIEAEGKYENITFKKLQNKLCEKLSIKIYNKSFLLKRFYATATRTPKWLVTYFDGWNPTPAKPSDKEIEAGLTYTKFDRLGGPWVTEELCLINDLKEENEREYLGL